MTRKRAARPHAGEPALQGKYVPSGERTHVHSCRRVIAAVSAPTFLLFRQLHLAGPLFLMVQNRERRLREAPLLVFHPQPFAHNL